MKQFNLEAAKNGAPVCTKSGKPVRLICFDRASSRYPLVGLIKTSDGADTIYVYTSDGYYIDPDEPSSMDLIMASIKHFAYMAIGTGASHKCRTNNSTLHDSPVDADKAGNFMFGEGNYIVTKVEWEE